MNILSNLKHSSTFSFLVHNKKKKKISKTSSNTVPFQANYLSLEGSYENIGVIQIAKKYNTKKERRKNVF